MTAANLRQGTPPRTGIGEPGLVVAVAVVLGAVGWAFWSSGQYDGDLERRWALPFEAKALAEEEVTLTPRSVGELAEPDLKAAADRYTQALDTLRSDLECRWASGGVTEAEYQAEWERGSAAARARHLRETGEATDRAERLATELTARTADRRRELRRQARALVAEWDALFARHPEWPPHRLAPPPE